MSNSVKKTQNKGYYGVQGHSRSSRSVYRKPVCDFRGMDASAIRTPLGGMGETRLLCGPFSGLVNGTAALCVDWNFVSCVRAIGWQAGRACWLRSYVCPSGGWPRSVGERHIVLFARWMALRRSWVCTSLSWKGWSASKSCVIVSSGVVDPDKCDLGVMSARRKGKLPQRKRAGVGGTVTQSIYVCLQF